MKTLGELRIGDLFYLLHYNGGYCELIEENLVGLITEIKIGCIIKWLDKEGQVFEFEGKYYYVKIVKESKCFPNNPINRRVWFCLNNDRKNY